MAEPLPDGVFPRLNASLLRSGSWNDCLASFVGKLEGDNTFRCCDGGTVQLQGEYFDPESVPRDSVVEIMGQTVDASSVSVRAGLKFWCVRGFADVSS